MTLSVGLSNSINSCSCSYSRPLARHQRPFLRPHRRRPTHFKAEPDRTPQQSRAEAVEQEFVGLSPEEDWEVQGGINDSLSQNTKLGQAVHNACLELDALSRLERENLLKANDLLKQLGYKGDLLQAEDDSESEDHGT